MVITGKKGISCCGREYIRVSAYPHRANQQPAYTHTHADAKCKTPNLKNPQTHAILLFSASECVHGMGGPLHTSNEREANNNQDMVGMLTRPAPRQHD